jgi:mannose-1-phosphate guanylyltransferase
MAGGIGSRLWPRSRNQTPKQFLDLITDNTMLQETVRRVEPLVSLERLLVVVGCDHAQTVLDQVPGLPAENVIVEPARRNTAPCIGLAAVVIRGRDPDAAMAVMPSDHLVLDVDGFRRAALAAAEVAARGHLVTLGITPAGPHTGYGYIQRGAALPSAGGLDVYQVRRFAEKPDEDTARCFVESGDYYWNAGIFFWRVDRILEEIARRLPVLAAELQAVGAAWGTPRQAEVLDAAWERVDPISIDFGVMEKADRVAVLPVDIGWDDVGSWATLAQLLTARDDDNLVHGAGRHLFVDTSGTYVHTVAGRLVAAVGLQDIIIVDTPDALLVCHKSQAQAVKKIVEQLEADGLDEYL